jgi:putative ABC transport system ATP-binding protein
MEPIIVTENVNRVFNVGSTQVHALKNVSIEIMPQTITILKGRSGSGKTTMINLLGTLDYPTDGKILFAGKDITRMGEGERDKIRRTQMGFIFQSVALISLMSAYENVDFGLRMAGKKKGRGKRTEDCLTFVGLRNRMNHRPAELSGGEQQRVAIARAIAHSPRVIFADEPTAELDTHMSLKIMKLFRDMVNREGVTLVMTTHDPQMMDLADRVYTLEDGEVVSEINNVITCEDGEAGNDTV